MKVTKISTDVKLFTLTGTIQGLNKLVSDLLLYEFLVQILIAICLYYSHSFL